MQGFHGAIIEPHRPILHLLALNPGHPHDDPIDQIDPFLTIAFQVVPMINLIDRLSVLQPPMNEFFDQRDTFLFELADEAEQSEPVVGV